MFVLFKNGDAVLDSVYYLFSPIKQYSIKVLLKNSGGKMINSQKKSKWSVYIADPEKDKELIFKARKIFFGHPGDEDYIEWLYYKNPAGPLHIAFAMDGDTIAGQYAVVPVNILLNGKQLKGSIPVDLFVNSRYRYQGIFTALAEAIHSRLSDYNVILTLGHTNKNSRHGFLNNLKFKEPYPSYFIVRPLSLIPGVHPVAGKICAKIPIGFINNTAGRLKALRFKLTDEPDRDELDTLWDTISSQINFGLVKDATWTKWRYKKNPHFSYRFVLAYKNGAPVGYVVWNKDKIMQDKYGYKSIVLMDIMAADLWIAVSLIQKFLEEIASLVHYVKAATLLWNREFYSLLMNGFIPLMPQSLILKVHDERLYDSISLQSKKWPHGYYISDSD